MNRVNTSLSALFSILCLMSFRFIGPVQESDLKTSDLDKQNASETVCDSVTYEYFYTSSERYKQYCDSLFAHMFDASNRPDRKVFDYAMKGYATLLGKDMLSKKNVLAFIDYSKSANDKRLWVVDIDAQKVLHYELVAHGRNTGEEYARKFSNKSNSYQSSIGFFVTGEIYSGKHELSIKMNGVERAYNGKAFDRGIVIHGAKYVNEEYIKENNRLGRSLGCPAVSEEVIEPMSEVISDGVCLFSYYPNKYYLKASRIINSDVVFSRPITTK
jgi:hypothetical protein